MNKSRKLKKAERALAKAEKAAVRAAQVVAKANKKRERILARERLRHDAEVARKAKKRAAKQGSAKQGSAKQESAKQGSAKQESAKQGSAKQVVQRAAKSAERVVEDAIDKVADTAVGLATTPRTLTPFERTAATTTTTTTTTVAELRELAKAQGIAGYSKLTKAELLSALDKG